MSTITSDKFAAYDRFAQIIWLRVKPDGIGFRVELGRLNEIAGLRRRTGWGFGGQAQMGEDFDNHGGIFNGGDERHRCTTVQTEYHVDREHAFEQLGPAQAGSRGRRGSLALRLSGRRYLVGEVDLNSRIIATA